MDVVLPIRAPIYTSYYRKNIKLHLNRKVETRNKKFKIKSLNHFQRSTIGVMFDRVVSIDTHKYIV